MHAYACIQRHSLQAVGSRTHARMCMHTKTSLPSCGNACACIQRCPVRAVRLSTRSCLCMHTKKCRNLMRAVSVHTHACTQTCGCMHTCMCQPMQAMYSLDPPALPVAGAPCIHSYPPPQCIPYHPPPQCIHFSHITLHLNACKGCKPGACTPNSSLKFSAWDFTCGQVRCPQARTGMPVGTCLLPPPTPTHPPTQPPSHTATHRDASVAGSATS